nr:SWIB/MDM2 domain-containing protein [Sphingomonas sp. Ant H11]
MWAYIKAHNLQNPENKREIVADEKLKKVFGKDKVTMFEMNKHLAGHMKA